MARFRRLCCSLVVLVLAAAGLLAPAAAFARPPAEPSARAAFTLVASPNPAIAKERVTLGGVLPTRAARPVVLQQYTSGAWRKVAARTSTTTGRYAFGVVAPATARRYRVVAPRTTRFAAATSPARTLAIAAQKATATAPATVVAGATFVFSATFKPVRVGRYVDVQSLTDGVWETVVTYKQDADGVGYQALGLGAPGVEQLRARARASNGAPAVTTNVVTLTVTAPPVPRMVRITPNGSGNPPRLVGQRADGSEVLWFRDDDGDQVGTFRLWHRATGTTTTVDPPPGYAAGDRVAGADAITPDLRWAVISRHFGEDDSYELYLWDRQQATLTLITDAVGGGRSHGQTIAASISDDGRYVAFDTRAGNLVADDPNPVYPDVFVWDRDTGDTQAVTTTAADPIEIQPTREPMLSPDGSYVLYYDLDNDADPETEETVELVRWVRATGVRTFASLAGIDLSLGRFRVDHPFSADGRYVLLAAAEAGTGIGRSIVWDTTTNDWTPVPEVPVPGAPGTTAALDPSAISADGSVVAGSICDQLWGTVCQVHAWQIGSPTVELVSADPDTGDPGTRVSAGGAFSADGRYLVFSTDAEEVAPGVPAGYGGLVIWDREPTG